MMDKPHIYWGSGTWACSMFIAGRPMHGYGSSIRLAYLDWCVNVYGATHSENTHGPTVAWRTDN